MLRETYKDTATEIAKRHGIGEATIYAWRKRFSNLKCPETGAPRLLFLGTGSAKPSSKRGESAVLVEWSGTTSLLDCGGGTYGQCLRLLGPDRTREVLGRLDAVWLSHAHLDHCGGVQGSKRVRTSHLLKALRISRVSVSPLWFHKLIRFGPR